MKTLLELMETATLQTAVKNLIDQIQQHVAKAEVINISGADWNLMMKALKSSEVPGVSMTLDEVQKLKGLLNKLQGEKVYTKENLLKVRNFLVNHPKSGVKEIMHLLGVGEEDAEHLLDDLHREGYGRTPEQAIKDYLSDVPDMATANDIVKELKRYGFEQNTLTAILSRMYQSGEVGSRSRHGTVGYFLN